MRRVKTGDRPRKQSRLKRKCLAQKTAPPTPGGISRNGRLARHVLWVHAPQGETIKEVL
jgi:hypothetical protein